ncbi:MAG: HlyC/CorC family transporter [Lachnospiraceae bacterium]|nr:HlyC/CorC family transporter [Lachnospiraceae bacterium]
MDSGDIIRLIVLIILIVLSGVFSSAETAIMTVNKIRLRALAEEGNKKAKKLLDITEEPSKLLGAILIGNNVVNLSASSLATLFTTKVLLQNFGAGVAAYAAGIATGVLTLLVLVFGELTPKTLATVKAEKLSLLYVTPICGLMWILTPLIFITNVLAGGVLKLLGVSKDDKEKAITERELRTIVDVSHEEGVLETDEKKMINNVVDFGDAKAKDIMVPRADMTMLDVNCSYQELVKCFRENRYTRFPVYEDSKDNVIGILNVKDLLLEKPGRTFSLRRYLRKPHFVFENRRLGEMLAQMREGGVSITIVLNEYGAPVGMITLEDLLEEIVGEIRDEYDEEEKDSIRKIGDHEYLIDGAMKLDDINEQLGLELTSEDYDSLGGLMIELLDALPAGGERIRHDGITYVVEKMNRNRVEKVRLTIEKTEEEESENP